MSQPYDPYRQPRPYDPARQHPQYDPRRQPPPDPRYPAGYPQQQPPQQRTPQRASDETRRDVEAALAARAELGADYDDAIASGLAERVEQLAAYRTAELRQGVDRDNREAEAEKSARTQRFVLGIISLGAGIPITGISATTVEPGILGMAISWAGIVGVNVAFALGNRKRRG